MRYAWNNVKSLSSLFIFPIIMSVSLSIGHAQSLTREQKIKDFFLKKEVTIAVTDSGLGGLSVMADVAARMKEAGIFRKVNFLFFNALFSLEGGYNSLKTREEKILIFNSALESLEKKYQPDLLLIGCNTLSVIFGDTAFSRTTPVPVIGIVNAGVELMAEALRTNPDSKVILFATPTTISEGLYQKRLAEMGFPEDRIIPQACPELECYIENGPLNEETEMLISGYVSEALGKLPSPRPLISASLNCTHYGYSFRLWEKAFENEEAELLVLVNPNSRMADVIFQKEYFGRFPTTEIHAVVRSMVEISAEKIDAIGSLLKKICPETAAALACYELEPDLFEWKKYVKE